MSHTLRRSGFAPATHADIVRQRAGEVGILEITREQRELLVKALDFSLESRKAGRCEGASVKERASVAHQPAHAPKQLGGRPRRGSV